MIDEKKLIEEIEILRVPANGFRGGKILLSEFAVCYKELILRIIEEQPKVGEWIPCSEMLPSIDMSYPNAKDYLVYYEQGYYGIASYSNINRFWHEHTTKPYWNCEQYCNVIAWMQLPEPYKG